MRSFTSPGCSSGATCDPRSTISISAPGILFCIDSARTAGVKVSRSPATTSTGTSIVGRRSSAVCSPAACSIRRNIGTSTWVTCVR